jgi:type IV pilus assembly protein PilB
LALAYRVVPVRLEGDALILAMAYPLDGNAIDDLRWAVGRDICPAVAFRAAIVMALEKYYSKDQTALFAPTTLN